MKVDKFVEMLDDFLDELKDDKQKFKANILNLESFKEKNASFIEWVGIFLKWSEVTTEMASAYYEHYDEDIE